MGMQCAVIEYGRNVCGLDDANSTEIDPDTPHPIVCLMEEQKDVKTMGATMRLGAWDCKLEAGSRTAKHYGNTDISERHRHRYEFNNAYRDAIRDNGMSLVGTTPDNSLIEIVEIPEHPWFIATQFHPEFKSQPFKPHPLFAGFVEAAISRKDDRASVAAGAQL